jgi:uncharacterized membrane protein
MRRLHRIDKCPERRKGNIIVLAAVFMVIVFGFVVLTVDIGFITVAKTQLHGASDGAALAAGIELMDGLGLDASKTATEVSYLAQQAAIDVASENRGPVQIRSTSTPRATFALANGNGIALQGRGKQLGE